MPIAKGRIIQGCWICRIRRKKCDETRPVCDNCRGLGLSCLYGEAKPDWMDRGTRQQEMLDTIKEQIKQRTATRRERHLMRSEGGNFISVSLDKHNNQAPQLTAEPDAAVEADAERHAPVRVSFQSDDSPHVRLDQEAEVHFTMTYLDHVFPFIFPFYHPRLVDNGRSWVLDVLRRSDAFLRLALSLASYFFSVEIESVHRDSHDDSCRSMVWDQLAKEMERAISSTHRDVQLVAAQGPGASVSQTVLVMGSIIHLLIFETIVQRVPDWNVHLSPALLLFEQLMSHHADSSSQRSGFDAALDHLTRPSWATLSLISPQPSTADQAAFRFFTANLLFIDIISSTALERSPCLQAHHHTLLSHPDPDAAPSIKLDEYVCCQNWALVAVGQISALSLWKTAARDAGTLSVVELVKKTESISEALDRGLARLGVEESTPLHAPSTIFEPFHPLRRSETTATPSRTTTRIWALAAKIYLSVVESGWQPFNQTIRAAVSETLVLLQQVPSPAQLRALSWPLCVAGSLATPNQEEAFREILTRFEVLHHLGPINDVQQTLEQIWARRQEFNGTDRDLTWCLNLLGRPLLLV